MSFTGATDQFTYNGTPTPTPTITSITSGLGPPYGGTDVTIAGTNFLTGVTSVHFGSVSTNGFLVNSATSITAIAPAGIGIVDVTVTNSAGTSATSAADQFIYTAGNTHDYNSDGKSDILFRNTGGAVAMWLMNGSRVSSSTGLGTIAGTWSIVGQRDFNGDGAADLLWRDSSGDLAMWLMSGASVSSSASLGNVATNWTIYGTGDLDGDGNGDLLWQDTAGDLAVWFMNGTAVSSTASLGNVPTNWSIAGDDNKGDIFWRDTAGDLAIWQVNASQVAAAGGLGNVPNNWVIAGIGDFNGDGVTDILWRDNNSGTVAIWFMNGGMQVQSTTNLGALPPNTWTIAQTGDYNGDGMSDILWIDSSGDVVIWFMNGSTVASSASLGNIGTAWTPQAQNAE
jgi:hypothetical protein